MKKKICHTDLSKWTLNQNMTVKIFSWIAAGWTFNRDVIVKIFIWIAAGWTFNRDVIVKYLFGKLRVGHSIER